MAGRRARSAWIAAALAMAMVYFFARQQLAVPELNNTALPELTLTPAAVDDEDDIDGALDDTQQETDYYQRTLMRCNQSTFGAAERTPGTLAYKIKQADWCVVRARRMR